MKKQSVDKARAKLVKHRHKDRIKANRSLHKRLMLHPSTIFILLCSGMLLFTLTWKTSADDYTVNAVIPADVLSSPAIITSPTNGQHFGAKPIAVSGTCPYKSYIKLYRNDIFSGTTICNPDGTFGLLTDLAVGANNLQVHIYSVTDDEGPLSPSITVYYDRPLSVKTTPAATPFGLSSDYKYRGYKPGENVSWTVVVKGGSGPYAFNAKWGDGTEANYVQMDAKDLVIEHSYKKAGTYSVRINGADAKGETAFLQLTALVVNDKHLVPIAGATTPPSLMDKLHNWLWLLWPSYLLLILMAISFWLGEREELRILQHKSANRLRHT